MMTVFSILVAAPEKRAGLLSGGQRPSLAVAMGLKEVKSDLKRGLKYS